MYFLFKLLSIVKLQGPKNNHRNVMKDRGPGPSNHVGANRSTRIHILCACPLHKREDMKECSHFLDAEK